MAPDDPGIMDTFFAKILYAVLGKAAKAVGSDFGKWYEDFDKQLRASGLERPIEIAKTGGGFIGGVGGTTPADILAAAVGTKKAGPECLEGISGLIGAVEAITGLNKTGAGQVVRQQTDYITRHLHPIWLPDPGTLIAGRIKTGPTVLYDRAMRLHGLGSWAVQAFEDAARLRLSVSDYWTLYRRGEITKEDFTGKYLSYAGMFEKERAFVDKLSVRLPGIGDLWTALRREGITASAFADQLHRLGYNKTDADFFGDVLRLDMPVDALTLLKRHGFIDEGTYQKRLQQVGYRPADLAALVNAAWVYPDLSAYYGLERRGVITPAELRDGLKGIGYSPADVGRMEHLRHEVPDPRTVIEWRRRGLIDDAGQAALFKAAGLSPAHVGYMKELTWLIPGPADLVSMAVREAFTPAAITKFQLHEDFPDKFREWGEKVGLSEDWAKAYWAAHWVLPGVREVFEIFHRIDRKTRKPLIDVATMDEYLKVADISPYWRPFLRAISYNPFTRVDVRRMYREEVIDEDEVFDTYRDLGYDGPKARQLTDWTKIAYMPRNTDLTRADILDAYRKGLFPRLTAANYLDAIGIREGDAVFYLNRVEYLIEKDKKEVTLASLKAMYLDDLIGLGAIRDRLHKDNYAEGEIIRLIHLWQTEKEKKVATKAARRAKPSRSELDGFFKAGVISLDTYMDEMQELGYSDKYIGWYVTAIYLGLEGG